MELHGGVILAKPVAQTQRGRHLFFATRTRQREELSLKDVCHSWGSVPDGFLIGLQAFDRDGDNKLDISDLGPLLEMVTQGSGRRLGSSGIEEALQNLSGDSDDQVRASIVGRG